MRKTLDKKSHICYINLTIDHYREINSIGGISCEKTLFSPCTALTRAATRKTAPIRKRSRCRMKSSCVKLSVSTMSLSNSETTAEATRTLNMPTFWCSTVTTITPTSGKTGSGRKTWQRCCPMWLSPPIPAEMTMCRKKGDRPGHASTSSSQSNASPMPGNTHHSKGKPLSRFLSLTKTRWMPGVFSSAPMRTRLNSTRGPSTSPVILPCRRRNRLMNTA